MHTLSQMFLLSCMLFLATPQQYPQCPSGSPVEIGNSTNMQYLNIIQMSSFIGYYQQDMKEAFSVYLASGSIDKVNSILKKNQTFYIIITVILVAVSLILFVVLVRMGDIKMTSKQIFQQLASQGHSSPLSAFFTLTAVVLLASTCFNGYMIPMMMQSLQQTQCKLDGFNEVYLNGSPQNDWDGVNSFIDKLTLIANLSSNIKSISQSALQINQNITQIGEICLNSAQSKYNGIKDQYSKAIIVDSYQNLALNAFIPYLFANSTDNSILSIFNELDQYFNLFSFSFHFFDSVEHLFNDTSPEMGTFTQQANQASKTISIYEINYKKHYITFRDKIKDYFLSGLKILIISEMSTGIAIVCCLTSLISIRLIHYKYDFFSLKIYKIIWASHILVFCLNLVFLLMFNQIYIYAEGACSLTTNVLKNHTLLQTLVPLTAADSDLYLLKQCLYGNYDYSNNTKTNLLFQVTESILQVKQMFELNYTSSNLPIFINILRNIQSHLLPYQMGVMGNYSYESSQLKQINNILLNNPFNQSCFKHHWEFSSKYCNSNEQIIVLPSKIFIPLLNSSNFKLVKSTCYLLSNYSGRNPHFITMAQFLNLYSSFQGHCHQSFNALNQPIKGFFEAESAKESIIKSLIQQSYNLSPYLNNVTAQMLNYLNYRQPFMNSIFTNLTTVTQSFNISKGNSCRIVKSFVNGIYNQFCVNFRGQSREVYLMVMCNLGYSLILILLSLLYAIELRSIGRNTKNQPQISDRILFQRTKRISDQNSSNSSLQLDETISKKSDENK